MTRADDTHSTKVSIGLPVYNGEKYLARAIDSVIAQVFEDWELLISDNGSEDSTLEIATTYAEQDSRIRVRSFSHNQGAVANFEVVFRETDAPYFMWLAFDDWLDPTYLSSCLAMLESDPTSVLAFTGMHVVDESGTPFRSRDEDLAGAESPDPVARFHSLLWHLEDPTSPVFGVARRWALSRTGLIRNSNEPDRVLLGELSVIGPLLQDKRRLFYHLGPPGHTDRDNWAWLNPRNVGRPRFATPRIVGYQAMAVLRSDHAFWQKWMMVIDLIVASLVMRTKGKVAAINKSRRKSRR